MRLLIALCVCVLSPALSAAEVPKPGTTGVAASTPERGRADAKADAGREALRRYRADQAGNPQAVVDAALAFTEAHEQYQRLGDTDAVCDMQANIFWCKKQMNMGAIQDYLARKGGEHGGTVKRMEEVATRQVDASEATDYLARADRFANDHASDALAVSIRYFEVAERFVGTPVGIEAQKKSLAAQNAAMKAASAAQAAVRATRFTAPAVIAGGKQQAVPAEAQLKQALSEVKKLYAKDYSAARDPAGKRLLGKRLRSEAERSKDDASAYHALLSESIRLAVEGEDWARALDGIEALAAVFTGVDAATEQRAAMTRARAKPVAAAILTLLDKPTDPQANLIAGRWFCSEAGRWDEGLPMLASSADADLRTIAEMELAKPRTDAERISSGDAWYALAKKAGRSEERNAAYARAMFWYRKVAESVSGVTKERLQSRLDEIDKALPLDLERIDWDNITATQWGKLKATSITIEARTDRTDSGIDLKAGDKVRVVPNPADRWSFRVYGREVVTDAKGKEFWEGRIAYGRIVVWVGAGQQQRYSQPIEGPGRLYISPFKPDAPDETKGAIRVKILPVQDD